MSPGNVAREGIPFELFRSTYPGRHVARESYPQRQVARETPDLSLGIVANVVVVDGGGVMVLLPVGTMARGVIPVDDLLQLVPQLMTRVGSLEKDLKQTKLTMGSAIVKLVKKVKKLEGILKRRNVVFSDSEEEEPEDQGRKREEQVKDISPTTLEAAKTLSRVASQKPKSIDKGRRYNRRKETKRKKVVTSLDFLEEVSTGYAEGVNTGSIKVSNVSGKVSTVSGQVSTDSIKKSIPSPDKGQREGKAPMIIEEAPKKTKEQILQEEASLVEAIRLDTWVNRQRSYYTFPKSLPKLLNFHFVHLGY
ncbi:hypothetical protein Tco_0120653 [Tanacetum coccineum]